MQKPLSFPITTITALIVLSGICIFCFYHFLSFTDDDVVQYTALMAESHPSKKSTDPYTAKQERKHLHKHIWTNDKQQNLQLCIHSEDAELVLDRHDDSTQIIEHMQNVHCYMQEELVYVLPDGTEAIKDADGTLKLKDSGLLASENANEAKPMQHVRYFEANSASYYYETDKVIANNVKISRVIMPGHEIKDDLDRTPILSGIADTVEFFMSGQDPQFKANNVTVIFHHPG